MNRAGFHNALTVVLATILVAGCSTAPPRPILVDGKPLPAIVVAESDTGEGKPEMKEKINSLIAAGRYDDLEKLAAELRESQASYAGGFWKLDVYYLTLGHLPDKATEKDWQERLAKLEAWAKKKPDSPTPRVALIDALVAYAWAARGNGYAQTVGEEARELMEKRLERARLVFEEAKTLPAKCPRLYSAAQLIALGEEWSSKDYEKLVESAVTLAPPYRTPFFYKAYYLLPRWYGKEGDWEKFVAAKADSIGGPEGDRFYAQAVGYQSKMYGNIIKDSQVSWRRAREGFELLLKDYPTSASLNNRYAFLCALNGERGRVRELFGTIGGNCDLEIWRTEEYFSKIRNWAYSD